VTCVGGLVFVEHGVNAVEMLANLAAGIATANVSGRHPEVTKFMSSLKNITELSPGPDYYGNLINLRIQVPWDENFSDDELIMLPFLTLTFLAQHFPDSPLDMDQISSALYHVWQLASPSRSSLWSAIALYSDSLATHPSMTAADRAKAQDDMLWNLRTWPRDQVTWNISNAQRQDIVYNPFSDRAARVHNQCYLKVLPANERSQTRWNANPWELGDGGAGDVEFDGGAWLLPYWLARFAGLLSA